MSQLSLYRKKTRRGFTLIELLLVMVIIAILAAIVVPKFVGRREQADKTKTVGDIANIKLELSAFSADIGRYPTTEEGLQALVTKPGDLPEWKGYLEKLPVDPWKHNYVYRCPGTNGKEYDLYSTGPSGSDQQGGGDNISD